MKKSENFNSLRQISFNYVKKTIRGTPPVGIRLKTIFKLSLHYHVSWDTLYEEFYQFQTPLVLFLGTANVISSNPANRVVYFYESPRGVGMIFDDEMIKWK